MSEISDLVAAQLSKAAYIPVPEWGFETINQHLPEGWQGVPSLSVWGGSAESPDRNNQMIAFANHDLKVLVLAFKGSDNLQNFRSDLVNDGDSEWRSLEHNCDLIHRFLTSDKTISPLQAVDLLANANVLNNGNPLFLKDENGQPLAISEYKGWTIRVTGHSLGAEMAQRFAVSHGLSGYTQNALPVSKRAQQDHDYCNIKDPSQPANLSWAEAAKNWREHVLPNGEHNTLRATIVGNDIATLYYKDFRGMEYINTCEIHVQPASARPVAADPHGATAVPDIQIETPQDLQSVASPDAHQRHVLGSHVAHAATTVAGVVTRAATAARARAGNFLAAASVWTYINAHKCDTVIDALMANPDKVLAESQNYDYYHRPIVPPRRATLAVSPGVTGAPPWPIAPDTHNNLPVPSPVRASTSPSPLAGEFPLQNEAPVLGKRKASPVDEQVGSPPKYAPELRGSPEILPKNLKHDLAAPRARKKSRKF